MTPLQCIGIRLLFWLAKHLIRDMLDATSRMELDRIFISLSNETGIFRTKEVPRGTISPAS